MAVNIHITIIELNALHTKRQNLFTELDAVIHVLMEAKHWGLRKSRNATGLNSRFKSLDTLKVKIISVTFFFFQAEDGIRDLTVTGVQTCALPICRQPGRGHSPVLLRDADIEGAGGEFLAEQVEPGAGRHRGGDRHDLVVLARLLDQALGEHLGVRSEERRVGKECRKRWCEDH